MADPPPPGRPALTQLGPVAVVVVTHQSASVIEPCLRAVLAAAPRRGVRPVVVDNASTDDGPERATERVGPGRVLRLPTNRGFAAGVNAGLAAVDTPLVAVVNPDIEIPPGALDALADELDRHPDAGLAGPGAADASGRLERTVGPFPSPAREWAHSWLLDYLGWPGRFAPQPRTSASVDWVSGCAWLLRREAIAAVGPLDEEYFMYFEDVDYCRRLHTAGWDVIHVPTVRWRHGLGMGSSGTRLQPADGGPAALRYFRKFHPAVPEARVRAMLVRGWALRRAARRARAVLGHAPSAAVAERYRIAIEQARRV